MVERLTGRPAENFTAIARRYAARPEARRTAANLARMLARMAVLPMAPGLRIDAYARAHGFPAPSAPRLSAKDLRWQREHGAPAPAAAE